MTSKFSAEDANAFLDRNYGDFVSNMRLTEMERGKAIMRYVAKPFDVRRDDYFSAQSLLAITDSVAYFAILTETGKVQNLKTSNLNISFLEPCMGPVAIAKGRLVKLGTSLATIAVNVRSEGDEEPACRAIVTYALPREIHEAIT